MADGKLDPRLIDSDDNLPELETPDDDTTYFAWQDGVPVFVRNANLPLDPVVNPLTGGLQEKKTFVADGYGNSFQMVYAPEDANHVVTFWDSQFYEGTIEVAGNVVTFADVPPVNTKISIFVLTVPQPPTAAGGAGAIGAVQYKGTTGSLDAEDAFKYDEATNTLTVENITLAGTIDGRDPSTDGTKLDTIDTGATDDQTPTEIANAYGSIVAQVSSPEKSAGTETAIRRFAPKDVYDMAVLHGGGGGAGITDHGMLAGLEDDDHTQYHTDARGDARYYTQSAADTLLNAKEDIVNLGTAAYADAGTAVGELVQLEDIGGGTPGLPALDGSQLTGLPDVGPLNNFTATLDPTVDDDSGGGYSAGSGWLNTVNATYWVLKDPSPGAAVWIDLTDSTSAGTTTTDASAAITIDSSTADNSRIVLIGDDIDQTITVDTMTDDQLVTLVRGDDTYLPSSVMIVAGTATLSYDTTVFSNTIIEYGAVSLYALDGVVYLIGALTPNNDASSALVTATSGITARTLGDRADDRVNVLDYGAVGDGATDDTTAVQAAIDTGKPVWFPETGTFVVAALVPYNAKINLFSRGAILKGTGTKAVHGVHSNVDNAVIELRGLRFTNFNITVFGDDASLKIIDNVIIEDCEVDTCNRGLWFNTRVSRARVVNNQIHDIAHASNSAAAILLGNLPNSSPGSIGDEEGNYIVTGNHIWNITAPIANECHGIWVGGRWSIIAHNHLTDVGNDAIGAKFEGIYTKTRWTIISENILVNAGTGQGMIAVKGHASGESPATTLYGYGNVVIGNQIYGDDALYPSQGIHVAANDILVTGNKFYGLYGTSAIDVAPSSNYDNHQFSNNQFFSLKTRRAIYARGCKKNIVIAGNQVAEFTSSSAYAHAQIIMYQTGFAAGGTVPDVTIRDNTITLATTVNCTGNIYGVVVQADDAETIGQLAMDSNNVSVAYAKTTRSYMITRAGSGVVTSAFLRGNQSIGAPTAHLFWDGGPAPADLHEFGNSWNPRVAYATAQPGRSSVAGEIIINSDPSGNEPVAWFSAGSGAWQDVVGANASPFIAAVAADGANVEVGAAVAIASKGTSTEPNYLGSSSAIIAGAAWDSTHPAVPYGKWRVADASYPGGIVSYASIFGGYDQINNQYGGSIFESNHSVLAYNAAGHGNIFGGSYNYNEGQNSGILFGTACAIINTATYKGSIINGRACLIDNASYTLIGGREVKAYAPYGFAYGYGITISLGHDSAVIWGQDATTLCDHSTTRGLPKLVMVNDVRTIELGFKARTTDGTPTNMTVLPDAFPAGEVHGGIIEFHLYAMRDGGANGHDDADFAHSYFSATSSFMWDRDANQGRFGTDTLGASKVLTLSAVHDNITGLGSQVINLNTNQIKPNVTGKAATTINWVGRMRLVMTCVATDD